MSDTPDHLTSALADRYALERELGFGGMATVYLAHDVKHDRKVAVKVLRPELAAVVGTERFLNEIKVTANLNHPHILPLLDSGTVEEQPSARPTVRPSAFLYYVMPYVEGASLRDKLNREKQLSVEESKAITTSVASALDYAHRRHVIHRDIKPENVLFSEGHAVVADFGISLAVKSAGGERLTEAGMAIGTPAYMSPEQLAGDREIDARSDIYSLACVVYEMLAGEPPFTGPNPQAVLARHVTDPPPPISTVRPSVPTSVVEALEKALAKVPADRFPTAAAFSNALSDTDIRQPTVSVRAGAQTPESAPKKKSLAVLPLQNLSGHPDQSFFADGLTEALITDLAKIEDFRVTSRTSVMRYRDTTKSIPEIARDLGVDLIIEGSVLRDGDDVRVTAQLIDAATDAHVWADSYDRKLTSILSLQAEVAREVAQEVKGRLSSQDEVRLRDRNLVNPAAHDAYLRGRHFWNLRGKNLEKGLPWFERSLELDPDYAPAHAGRADTYALLGFYGVQRPHDAMPIAKEEARRALELDSQLGEPHACLGYVHTIYDWRLDDAEVEFQKAYELNPSNGSYWYWHANLMGARGRYDDAVDLLKRGLEYDPLSIYMHSHLGLTQFMAGRFREAEKTYQYTLELEPTLTLARSNLGLVYHFQGRSEEGLQEIRRGVDESGRQQFDLWILGSTCADLGMHDEAEAVLNELMDRRKSEFIMNGFIASIHALLGRDEEAFRWLDRAFNERESIVGGLGYHLPQWTFRGIESDQRFMDLVERVRGGGE